MVLSFHSANADIMWLNEWNGDRSGMRVYMCVRVCVYICMYVSVLLLPNHEEKPAGDTGLFHFLVAVFDILCILPPKHFSICVRLACLMACIAETNHPGYQLSFLIARC